MFGSFHQLISYYLLMDHLISQLERRYTMYIKKKNVFVSLLMVSLSCLIGCGTNNGDVESIQVTDMVGDVVTISKNPKKVACVSRTTYDLLIAYGLGDRIDGVYNKVLDNEWTNIFYPDSSKHFAYSYENSYELFISRGIDLVFSPEKYISDELRNHGITAVTISLYGAPTFDNYVTYLSEFVTKVWDGEEIKAKATAWNYKVLKAIDDIQTELSKNQITTQKLYYVRGDKDKGCTYTDTKGSFTEYAYRKLGFNCLSAELDGSSNTPSAEAVCAMNPDVFVMGGIYQNKHVEDIRKTEPFTNLNAVKNNKIYTIPMGLTQMEQLNALTPEFFYDQANRLYPEIFDFDVTNMIKTSSKEYFGVDLTDQQVSYMLNGKKPNGDNLYE